MGEGGGRTCWRCRSETTSLTMSMPPVSRFEPKSDTHRDSHAPHPFVSSAVHCPAASLPRIAVRPAGGARRIALAEVAQNVRINTIGQPQPSVESLASRRGNRAPRTGRGRGDGRGEDLVEVLV